MPYSTEVQTAIENLKTLYNGDAYDATTNPGGMGEGGHRQNFEPALEAIGVVGEAIGIAIDDINAPDLRGRSDEFRAAFLGGQAADPSVDGNGDTVVAGQWYWNTTDSEVRIYNGSNWNVPVANATDYVPDSGGTFTGTLTALGGVVGSLTGNVTGDVTGNVSGNAGGNAATATKLESGRGIAISGAGITGSNGVFDGTSDLALTVDVEDDGHTHSFANLGLGTIASQNANSIEITGGTLGGVTLDDAPLGETIRSTAKVTTLEANDAVTLGTTLGVIGTATFTAQTVHPAGVNTNLIQGADGALILNADAGDSVEIQVAGTKVAEITPDGDVIASRYNFLHQQEYFSMRWSGNGSANEDVANNSPNFAILASDVDDPSSRFDIALGVYTVPVTGRYLISVSFPAPGNRSLRIMKSSGGGAYQVHHTIANEYGSFNTHMSISYFEALTAGEKLKLQAATQLSNNVDATMFSVGLMG